MAASRRCSVHTLFVALTISTVIGFGAPAHTQEPMAGVSVDVSGQLAIVHADDFATGRSELIHTLRDERTGESYRLHFESDVPRGLLTGQRLRLRGRAHDRDLYVAALDPAAPNLTASSSQALQPSGPIAGEQRTVVILVNFQDTLSEPYTATFARDVFFSQVDGFVREASSQKAWLAGDVFGYFTIALNSTVCDQFKLTELAKAAAVAAGVNFSAYNRHVYVYPRNTCSYDGAATVGGNPSEMWINGMLGLQVVGHELGHNFGLNHAHLLDCEGPSAIDLPCSAVEYGNMVDIMGSVGKGHYNAFMKERLGWLAYTGAPPIAQISASGTYQLEPYAAASQGGAKALKIPKGTDPVTGAKTYYYVEFRQAVGYDAFLANHGTNVLNGVVVHTGAPGDGNSSYLLDMNSSTFSWYDHALVVGRDFTDPAAGVTITPLSVASSGASVAITVGSTACSQANPAVSLTPGTSGTVAPGASFTYQVSVMNTDGSGCGSTAVALTPRVPGGWTAVLGRTSATLAPGETATTTMQVTSAQASVDGSYAIGIDATADRSTFNSASAAASFTIFSSFAVTAQPGRSVYARNQKPEVLASVAAGASPVAGAAVTFYVTRPDGSHVSWSSTTSDAGTAKYVMRLRPKDPVGTYYVRVRAELNAASGEGATSFVVQ